MKKLLYYSLIGMAVILALETWAFLDYALSDQPVAMCLAEAGQVLPCDTLLQEQELSPGETL